jgi:hypothetical protein
MTKPAAAGSAKPRPTETDPFGCVTYIDPGTLVASDGVTVQMQKTVQER